jgi:hypothetical protein
MPKPKKEKSQGGRPTKYDSRFCRIATDLSRLGLTNEQMAKSFDVSVSTFKLWMATYPEFSAALKDGREVSDANVVRSLYERAMGYTHDAVKILQDKGQPVIVPYKEHYPPDATALIFWLKNRRPDLWRNNPSPEDMDEVPNPVKVEITVVDGRKKADADA